MDLVVSRFAVLDYYSQGYDTVKTKILIAFALLILSTNLNAMTVKSTAQPPKKEGGGQLKIQPQLTIDDNTLKPTINFHTNTGTFMFNGTGAVKDTWLFEFRANSGINVSDFETPAESTEEIISEFVADGGNIEFELSYMVNLDNFDFALSGHYSLLTTDAVSTEQGSSSVISVDAEVYGISAYASYHFNNVVKGFIEYTTYDTSDDGVNADFTNILDDGEAIAFGISFPLGENNDGNNYHLSLTRTKHSEIDKAIFRLSISKPFNFFGS